MNKQQGFRAQSGFGAVSIMLSRAQSGSGALKSLSFRPQSGFGALNNSVFERPARHAVPVQWIFAPGYGQIAKVW